MILGALYEEDLPEVVQGGIVPVLWEPESSQRLSSFAQKEGKSIDVQIKIDTGMNRAGVMASEALNFITQVKEMPGLNLVGLLSHLAIADGEKPWKNAIPRIRRKFLLLFVRVPPLSICNLWPFTWPTVPVLSDMISRFATGPGRHCSLWFLS